MSTGVAKVCLFCMLAPGMTGSPVFCLSLRPTVKYLCAAVRRSLPAQEFSTIKIVLDCKRFHINALPNSNTLMLPLTHFAGGDVFITHPAGNSMHRVDGILVRGSKLFHCRFSLLQCPVCSPVQLHCWQALRWGARIQQRFRCFLACFRSLECRACKACGAFVSCGLGGCELL